MKLTDRSVAALKPKAHRYEVWDGQGFGVRVTPRGTKSWIWLYRHKGKPRRLTLGNYPALGLADARLRLAEERKKLDAGLDPGEIIVQAKRAERQAETVAELAECYLEGWARKHKRSAGEDERTLRKDVFPAWGSRKAKDIKRKDVIALLDRIEGRGAPIQANRTLAVIRKMFNWAMVRPPGKETQRDRVLSPSEIACFWAGLNEARMSETVRLALRLQLATAQRRGEVIGAEWKEFDFDESVWTIPGEKSKNRLPHRVPLSPFALRLLDLVKANAGHSHWLFPSPRGDKPITGRAVDHAVRNNREIIGIENVTPHDLRRTAASHMTSMGISRLTVSKLLNHAESGVTAVYDRHSYDAEKRQALEAWGRRLEKIVTGEFSPANVLQLRSHNQ
jgi:integrase